MRAWRAGAGRRGSRVHRRARKCPHPVPLRLQSQSGLCLRCLVCRPGQDLSFANRSSRTNLALDAKSLLSNADIGGRSLGTLIDSLRTVRSHALVRRVALHAYGYSLLVSVGLLPRFRLTSGPAPPGRNTAEAQHKYRNSSTRLSNVCSRDGLAYVRNSIPFGLTSLISHSRFHIAAECLTI